VSQIRRGIEPGLRLQVGAEPIEITVIKVYIGELVLDSRLSPHREAVIAATRRHPGQAIFRQVKGSACGITDAQ
jgi:hypothetical protein